VLFLIRRGAGVRRRDFILVFGGAAAAWPRVARAQQTPTPVVGFLSSQSPDGYGPYADSFRQGLSEAGYVEGQNVAIEYRWAHGEVDKLPALAAELVHRQVDVIAATGGILTAQAAMAATTSIPIVFNSGEDPVQAGLVRSLNRPGGNVTGISWFNVEVAAKRLALLHQVVPTATTAALMGNPRDPEHAPALSAVEDAARALGLDLIAVDAFTPDQIDTGFKTLVEKRVGLLVIASGAFFINQRTQLVALTAQYGIPGIYTGKESSADGGLMSYGNNLADAYHHNGLYVARILKGDKPGDLPIDRSTKFALVINLKTAKALALTIPPTLLALADEVIE
jgi:putative tryptophan/tyrosine transport system substrate-binding protein